MQRSILLVVVIAIVVTCYVRQEASRTHVLCQGLRSLSEPIVCALAIQELEKYEPGTRTVVFASDKPIHRAELQSALTWIKPCKFVFASSVDEDVLFVAEQGFAATALDFASALALIRSREFHNCSKYFPTFRTPQTDSWEYSFSCLSPYTEEELDWILESNPDRLKGDRPYFHRCRDAAEAATLECEKVLHSCSAELLRQYGLPSPAPLAFRGLDSERLSDRWRFLYHRLANRSIALWGDSLAYTLWSAILLRLKRLGYTCPAGRCPNGLSFTRVFGARLPNASTLPSVLRTYDASVFNLGLHYVMPIEAAVYEADLMGALRVLQSEGLRVAWLDTFRPHFPSPSGSYYEYVQYLHAGKVLARAGCAALGGDVRGKGYWNDVAERVLRSFPSMPKIRTSDITEPRYDIHTGPLTHFNMTKLDCVHICMQPCFWEPILSRFADFLLTV